MKIGFYKWQDISEADKTRLFKRGQADIEHVLEDVRPIIESVKTRGDAALFEYARTFDQADLDDLKVSEAEFDQAAQNLDPSIKKAIDHCADNVKRFHEAQLKRVETDWMVEIEPGVWAGEKVTPISSVGLYVPGGKNQYPSAVYMLGIPAVMADVPQIIMVSPPRPDGSIGAALLYAAQVSGITEFYKVGGAQAVAALAYGTQTVPSVKKVLGPGSPYVAAAKYLLGDRINPGMPAGPSESLILCDGSADPHNTVLDILNEAEHGPDSAALLVTHDESLAQSVYDALSGAIEALPEPQRGWLTTNMAHYSGIILTRDLEDSIVFCNDYAVEHLLLKVQNPEDVIPKLHNAGEILIGETTPSSFGNYGIGVNHVLPTGGNAHTYSCTSVWDFLKRTSLARMDKQGFENLKEDVCVLTEAEGFPAHGNAITQRKL